MSLKLLAARATTSSRRGDDRRRPRGGGVSDGFFVVVGELDLVSLSRPNSFIFLSLSCICFRRLSDALSNESSGLSLCSVTQ